MKFIHAHQMAKNTEGVADDTVADVVLGDLVVERGRGRGHGDHKAQLKKSSSTVARQCSSSVARATIGRYHAPVAVETRPRPPLPLASADDTAWSLSR